MSLMKKAIGGSIHRVREFELEKVNLIDEFDILQIVGEGWFGKILLTEHRSTQTEMVLKALPKAYTGISDFFREFHYGLHLAAHRNIITTYDVAFETAGFYVFSQEYAPLGDLTSNVTETGLGELHAKRVARQLAAAVHHIHSRELVHRDIKLDNILIFRSDFSRIKLCDFGETRRVNTVVRRHNEWLPYSPPEVLQIDTDETYKALTSHDVWQFGIVLFVCLTGCLPWQKAALDDPRYTRYQNWHNATLNIAKKPKLFQLISSRAQRLFKRLLDPKAEKRPVSVLEVNKYLEDRWLAKLGAEKAMNGGADERDELCPSMYSFHSSLEEKNQLLHTLTTYGIETTVDRAKKKARIREWIQSSAIAEENEEDEESDPNEEDALSYEREEEEPVSMRGRHFPEMRPSAKPKEHRIKKVRHGRRESIAKRRQSIRPLERKIPFAPQVAEERETVARFASFPNGDPNLAIVKNGTNESNGVAITGAGELSAQRSKIFADNGTTSSSKERSLDGSPARGVNNLAGNSTEKESGARSTPMEPVSSGGKVPNGESTVPASPQVPSRKHRTQTVATSPRSSESRVETMERSQSSASTTSRSIRSREKTESIESDGGSAKTLPMAASGKEEVGDERRNASSDKERSPITVAAQTNPLTMSVASQLVMQSFNVLQGINSVPVDARSSSSRSTSTTTSPPSVSSFSKANPRTPEEPAVTFTYGKDAFEHYGIAQGVILRSDAPFGRGSGSGSRSVSN